MTEGKHGGFRAGSGRPSKLQVEQELELFACIHDELSKPLHDSLALHKSLGPVKDAYDNNIARLKENGTDWEDSDWFGDIPDQIMQISEIHGHELEYRSNRHPSLKRAIVSALEKWNHGKRRRDQISVSTAYRIWTKLDKILNP